LGTRTRKGLVSPILARNRKEHKNCVNHVSAKGQKGKRLVNGSGTKRALYVAGRRRIALTFLSKEKIRMNIPRN